MRNNNSCTISTHLLLSCLFFAQLKLWKQFTGRNAMSLMQFTYSELLPKSVPSYPFSFLINTYCFLFSCLYPEIVIQSSSCYTLTLVIVRFILFGKRWKCQTVSTNNKDLTIFSIKDDLYNTACQLHSCRVAIQLKGDFWTGCNVFAEKKMHKKKLQNLKRLNFSPTRLWFLYAVA